MALLRRIQDDENLFKNWFLPHEDLIFWGLLLKQPVGGKRKTRSKIGHNSSVIYLWILTDGCSQFYLSVSKTLTLGLVAEFAVDGQSETFFFLSCFVHILNDLNTGLNNASVILPILFLF